jgi:uncharacterized protein (TIGR00369 family)
MRPLPHTHGCFVCGDSNPIGLRLRFETDGKIVQARFVPRAEHAGFRQVVHGGLTATVLDEIMVWACAVAARRFTFCAEMTVRYHAPIQPGQLVIARGQLVENRRGKLLLASGELRDQSETLLAASTGKYVPIKEQQTAELAADFAVDASWLLQADTADGGNR